MMLGYEEVTSIQHTALVVWLLDAALKVQKGV